MLEIIAWDLNLWKIYLLEKVFYKKSTNLMLNSTSAWMFSCKCSAYFPKNASGGLLLCVIWANFERCYSKFQYPGGKVCIVPGKRGTT